MRIQWSAIVQTAVAGLAIAATGGWLSTRDAARDAYNITIRNRDRIERLEERFDEARMRGELTHSEIPRLRDDIASVKRQQDWVVGVLYDLARAVRPTLPIEPPPGERGPSGG